MLRVVLVAALLLSGCSQMGVPIAVTNTQRTGETRVANTAASKTLLYVVVWLRSGKRIVDIFSYPRVKLIGSLTTFKRGAPLYLCSDDAGDVFVTAPIEVQLSNVYEYAPGSEQPIRTLVDPGMAQGCSVDPITGHVAVANFDSQYDKRGFGDIVIFPKGSKGRPKIYGNRAIQSFTFCAYDDNGNLLAGGIDRLDENSLAWLEAGSHSLTKLHFKEPLSLSGPVQWDGRYFAVGYATQDQLYQVAISGSTAKVVNSIELKHRGYEVNDEEFWVYRNSILAVVGTKSEPQSSLGLWKYPLGGNPTRGILAAM